MHPDSPVHPSQGQEGSYLSILPKSFFHFSDLFPMGGKLDVLPFFLESVMGGNCLLFVIDGDSVIICLKGQFFTNGPGGDCVSVTIKSYCKILIHIDLCGLSAVR